MGRIFYLGNIGGSEAAATRDKSPTKVVTVSICCVKSELVTLVFLTGTQSSPMSGVQCAFGHCLAPQREQRRARVSETRGQLCRIGSHRGASAGDRSKSGRVRPDDFTLKSNTHARSLGGAPLQRTSVGLLRASPVANSSKVRSGKTTLKRLKNIHLHTIMHTTPSTCPNCKI